MSDVNFASLSREMAGREGLGGSSIMFIIIALLGSALFWANWAELDNVTRGEGRIVSSVQNQIVQASEGGVILRQRQSIADDHGRKVKAEVRNVKVEAQAALTRAQITVLKERLHAKLGQKR